jgi:gluconate 2-dehydrogenase gamma chain
MSTKRRSRRSFLVDSVSGLNAAWVAANYHGILAAQEYVTQATQAGQLPRLAFFTDAQAAEIEAMTAQIIPTDETPGAREARCLYFIDRALSTFARSSQTAYIEGLRDLQAKTQQMYPDTGRFSALTSDQQIKMLTGIEKTPFFNMVRAHTVIGFLARPVHGGNYNKIGWKLISYDDSLNHKPPFGYYDAQPATPPSGVKEKLP